MSKLKNKGITISSPFDTTVHNTEWTAAALLANWINDISKEESIPIGIANVERRETQSGKRADISIPVSQLIDKLFCLISCTSSNFKILFLILKN